MAVSGIVLATRRPKFLLTFALTFVIFGTLMNLLSGSTAALNLFWLTDFGGKLAIIRDGLFGLFGVGRNFWDWLLLFSITLLQSILIGLVVLVWHQRRQHQKPSHQHQKPSRQAQSSSAERQPNADNLQNAGLAAGLAVLGSGCPTCGTTLLAPILGTLFSSGSYALASTLSGLLTTAAILLALFTLKRLGRDAFVLITSEDFCHRRAAKASAATPATQAPATKSPTAKASVASSTNQPQEENHVRNQPNH